MKYQIAFYHTKSIMYTDKTILISQDDKCAHYKSMISKNYHKASLALILGLT